MVVREIGPISEEEMGFFLKWSGLNRLISFG